jgi:tetratricopeptide (TPR) repeat protein
MEKQSMVNFMKSNIIFGILLLSCASGCTTTAKIQRPTPATINLGASKSLTVVQMSGKRSYREIIVEELAARSHKSNWWRFKDMQEKGIEINLKGDTASSTVEQPQEGEIFLRIDLYDVESDSDTEEKTTTVNGEKKTTRKKFFTAEGNLGVTTLDIKGRTRLSEKDYTGKSKIYEDKGDKTDAREASLANAVQLLLNDITPRFITETVRVDDKAKDLKPIIEMIKAKSYKKSAEALEKMMKADDSRSDVIYNLAVMEDAMGNYDRALELYSKSITLGGQKYYPESQAACTKRQAEYKALSQ